MRKLLQRRTITRLVLGCTAFLAVAGFVYVAEDNPLPDRVAVLVSALTTRQTKGQEYGIHGDAYLNLGDYNHAIAEFRKSLEYYPENGVTHYDLGLALYKRGLVTEACAEWKTVQEPQEEFVSPDAQDRIVAQSQMMLNKCHCR